MESSDRNNKNESKMFGRSQRQVRVFAVCLLISAVTWLLIKLSKEYITEIIYPVVYINMPPGKVLTSGPDSTLLISQKSNGYNTLLHKLLWKRNPIFIDLSELKLKKSGTFYEASLPTKELEERINNQLNRNEKLVNIAPNLLFFRFEAVYSKKVPVKTKLNLQFEKQFGLYDKVYTNMDSVTVSGPARQVRSMKEISTESQILSGIHENFYLTMNLDRSGSENIIVDPGYIYLFVPVMQYTESSVQVPVSLVGATGKYSIRTYPEKVKITYKVALSDYKKVDESMFRVTVPAKTAMAEGSSKIKVKLDSYPDFTEIVRIEPEFVEYIILK